VSSPDAFDRRIEEAARALRGRSTLPFEAVRAAARDFDTALDAAARDAAPKLPESAWVTLRERLADPDAALDAAARAATPAAPPVPYETIATRARRRSFVKSRLLLRTLVAAAASLLVAALFLFQRGRPAASEGPSALLTTAQLAQAERAESRLQTEADALARRVAERGAAAASEDGQALSEELAFLEAALGECRAALAGNELHPQLRRQLAELSERRLDLLRRIDALPAGSTPANGDGRG
jgi:hypothetical protein